MAWLERDGSGNIHVCFRLGERKFKRSLRTKDNRTATASCSRVEENIRLLEMGRLTIPAGANVAAFLLSDGKLTGKPEISASVSTGPFILRISSQPSGGFPRTRDAPHRTDSHGPH